MPRRGVSSRRGQEHRTVGLCNDGLQLASRDCQAFDVPGDLPTFDDLNVAIICR